VKLTFSDTSILRRIYFIFTRNKELACVCVCVYVCAMLMFSNLTMKLQWNLNIRVTRWTGQKWL